MIFELRTYTLHRGRAAEYWRHYANGCFAAQDPRLRDHLVGYFQSDMGPLNQIVHLWKYNDVAERAELREANYARPDWDAHLQKIRPLMARVLSHLIESAPALSREPATHERILDRWPGGAEGRCRRNGKCSRQEATLLVPSPVSGMCPVSGT